MKKAKLFFAVCLAAVFTAAASTHEISYGRNIDENLTYLGIRGDINEDSKLSVMDLIRYKQLAVNGYKPDYTDYCTDINGDGNIDYADVSELKSALLCERKIWSYKNIPVMDGSTSAIPLEAGMKARMLNIPFSDARKCVNHHKTHESFQRLLDGENDLIFTVPISESQQKKADDAGVHLNMIPVAKEAFVFVVNKNNPVDSLTQQQIKDIYSGKITNWSQLGGPDEKIIPYQRNSDSGSQNYMVDFMSDSELMKPEIEYEKKEMGALMDSIAVYDNTAQAIGYSVYSYAAQMYENSSEVKFISVDGIRPSKDTIADGTYPLLSSTYIMYTDNVSENTLDFIDWAVSEEGQKCVLRNGYVPVKDFEYPESYKAYSSKGTGIQKPENFVPSEKYSSFRDTTDISLQTGISFLKNKEFENEINNDIREAASGKATGNETVKISGLNGYMSVQIYINENETIYLNYDLIRNKKIEHFSDLFYKDTDFINYVNTNISSVIENSDYLKSSLMTDFLGLTGSAEDFSISEVGLGSENPYFESQQYINFQSYYYPLYMVTGEYFDMKQVINEDLVYIFDTDHPEWCYTMKEYPDGIKSTVVEGSMYHSQEEVEERRKLFEKIREQVIEIYKTDTVAGQYFEIADESQKSYTYYDHLNVICPYFYLTTGPHTMFDPDTGERIMYSDIFGEELAEYDNSYISIVKIDTENGLIYYGRANNTETIKFDPEKVNMKYIYQFREEPEITELEKPLFGLIRYNGDAYTEPSYSSDNHTINEKIIYAIKRCYYEGNVWYECRSYDDEYIGWISSGNIEFDMTDGEWFDKDEYNESESFSKVLNNYSEKFNNMIRFFMFYDLDMNGKTELIFTGTDENDNDVIDIWSSDKDGNAVLSGVIPSGDQRIYIDRKTCDIYTCAEYSENDETLLKIFRINCESGKYTFEECWNGPEMQSEYDLENMFILDINIYLSLIHDFNYYLDGICVEDGLKVPMICTAEKTELYSESYIKNRALKNVTGYLEAGKTVYYVSQIFSKGKIWLECYDSDTNKYLGWVDSFCLK